MKKLSLVLSAAALLFVGLTSEKKEITTLAIGADMPGKDLELTRTDENKTTLKDFKKDKGTLVIFSCNTCPFVVGSDNFEGWENSYNDIQAVAKANNIGAVLVNSNAAKRDKGDNLEDMRKRAEEKAYLMDYVLDKRSRLADEFGAKTTPHVFLFDANDKLVYEGQINDAYKPNNKKVKEYLKDALNALGTDKKIKNSKTDAVGCGIKRK
ncbi:redoxin family protein [Lishizhenia sp.]|uniref:redoxin family protein n=1 Tax=Lishizhenia sp. TaxID=2497594 RepID=UPI00299DEE87|nr:redoxin family protein [Lishizhenia sp.]MDX1445519.1 redoxin family protein [Lishizhenia sp.]